MGNPKDVARWARKWNQESWHGEPKWRHAGVYRWRHTNLPKAVGWRCKKMGLRQRGVSSPTLRSGRKELRCLKNKWLAGTQGTRIQIKTVKVREMWGQTSMLTSQRMQRKGKQAEACPGSSWIQTKKLVWADYNLKIRACRMTATEKCRSCFQRDKARACNTGHRVI